MYQTAREFLATYNVSMDDAKNWVFANVSNPEIIHSLLKSVGMTTTMLTEVVQQAIPDITTDTVRAYFAAANLDYMELDLPNFEAIKSSSELLNLTSSNDNLTGSAGIDIVDGGQGADTVDGGEGNDVLYGNSGNDVIDGGGGADYIEGGTGADTLNGGFASYYQDGYYQGNQWINGRTAFDQSPNVIHGDGGADKITGGAGDDFLYGDEGSDIIYGDSTIYYNTYGAYGHDRLYGGSGDDQLYGGGGNDLLSGGEGNDNLSSSGGNDTLDGGEGNDWISADASDSVYGGDGNDTISLYGDSNEQNHCIIVPGEGGDAIGIGGLSEQEKVTIDLTEGTAAHDTITTIGFDWGIAPETMLVEIKAFDIKSDTLNIGNYHLYGQSYASQGSAGLSGYYSANYTQIVDNPTDTYSLEKTSYPKAADDYGKGFFVIQESFAVSSDRATVAEFLDPYGNDAAYGNSSSHYFLINVGTEDCGLYLFKDDTGADRQVVADELTPIVLLAGLRTEDFSTADLINCFV